MAVSSDTIKLLKECDSGSKMAVASIDEVLDHASDAKFKDMLIAFKDKHTAYGNQIHGILLGYHEQDKEPAAIAKGMSWMKTNMKLMANESDATIADLMTEGCNMGVKSLSRYLNQYPAADEESKQICNQIISCEEQFAKDMRAYL